MQGSQPSMVAKSKTWREKAAQWQREHLAIKRSWSQILPGSGPFSFLFLPPSLCSVSLSRLLEQAQHYSFFMKMLCCATWCETSFLVKYHACVAPSCTPKNAYFVNENQYCTSSRDLIQDTLLRGRKRRKKPRNRHGLLHKGLHNSFRSWVLK